MSIVRQPWVEPVGGLSGFRCVWSSGVGWRGVGVLCGRHIHYITKGDETIHSLLRLMALKCEGVPRVGYGSVVEIRVGLMVEC